jgi:membrane associated rhomboid family serine protease
MSVDAPAALAILTITVVTSLLGLYARPEIIAKNLFRPYWLAPRREYWTVITSGFVHADLPHLLFNALTFFFFAFDLERVIGSPRFVLLYLAGLIASHLGTWVKQRSNPEYASLGASGAISAVLFAFVVYFPTASFFILPIPLPIPAPLFAVGYVAYSWYSARQARGRINHDAHLIGALAGIVFVFVTDPRAVNGLIEML